MAERQIDLDRHGALWYDDGKWTFGVVHVADVGGPGQHVWAVRSLDHDEAVVRLKTAYMRAYTESSRLLTESGPSDRQREYSERAERLRRELDALGVKP